MKRSVQIRVLEDGSPCLHYFVHDRAGKIQTPSGRVGRFAFPGSRGYVACRPERTSLERMGSQGQLIPTLITSEVRAVRCPDCQQTKIYQEARARLHKLLQEKGEALSQAR